MTRYPTQEDIFATVREEGILLVVDNIEYLNTEGALVCVTADMLAAKWLGKFKDVADVSFAVRGCQQ